MPERATLRPPTWVRVFLRVPLFYKILLANAVLIGLAGGVAAWASGHQGVSISALVAIVAGLSLMINGVLIRLALDPIRRLEDTARRVVEGDMRARVSGSIVADPDLARVTAAFNSVLDSIASYRLRLRAVVARAIEKDEEDRRRVARELYDETAQTLAALLLRIRLETEAGADPETLHDLCEEARREIAGAVDVLRGFADRGPPPLLEELGLDAAIQARVRSCRGAFAGVIEFGSTGAGQRLTEATERAVYHVIVEALGNAITHADASRIKVQLDFTPSDLTATVEDDGTGFDLSTVLPTRDVGLTAMRERVVSVGGTLDLESSAGHGTRARIVTPVSEGTKGPA